MGNATNLLSETMKETTEDKMIKIQKKKKEKSLKIQACARFHVFSLLRREGALKNLSFSDVVCRKNVRLVSRDAKHAVPQYKSLLCGNRRRFTTHDLKTIFMVPCNGSSLSV